MLGSNKGVHRFHPDALTLPRRQDKLKAEAVQVTFARLQAESDGLGKPEWRPMLRYTAELHGRSVHPPAGPFPYPWEEIGPGYCYGPAFGHQDLVHQVFDVLPAEPEHARHQLLNLLALQQPDGLLPGTVWMRTSQAEIATDRTMPPLWPAAVQEWCDRHGREDLIAECLPALQHQLAWFEAERRVEPEGCYYTDIFHRSSESGIDHSVRFDEVAAEPLACVDATAHVYWMYDHAARWSQRLGREAAPLRARAVALRGFIEAELLDPETGFFHDQWAVGRPERRPLAFEGMWPLVVGAAAPEQAARVIDENLLSPSRFFTPHPIAAVAPSDPRFELRMWRGPAWNSMTYWAARGCQRYGRADAAHRLLEAALDASAALFDGTGTVWEFYHPHRGDMRELHRKGDPACDAPCPDYLGHNPLLAMARLWETTA